MCNTDVAEGNWVLLNGESPQWSVVSSSLNYLHITPYLVTSETTRTDTPCLRLSLLSIFESFSAGTHAELKHVDKFLNVLIFVL